MTAMAGTTTDVDKQILVLTGKNYTLWVSGWKHDSWRRVSGTSSTLVQVLLKSKRTASNFVQSYWCNKCEGPVGETPKTLREYGCKYYCCYRGRDLSLQMLTSINGGAFQRLQTPYSKGKKCWRGDECNKCYTSHTAYLFWLFRIEPAWKMWWFA